MRTLSVITWIIVLWVSCPNIWGVLEEQQCIIDIDPGPVFGEGTVAPDSSHHGKHWVIYRVRDTDYPNVWIVDYNNGVERSWYVGRNKSVAWSLSSVRDNWGHTVPYHSGILTAPVYTKMEFLTVFAIIISIGGFFLMI